MDVQFRGRLKFPLRAKKTKESEEDLYEEPVTVKQNARRQKIVASEHNAAPVSAARLFRAKQNAGSEKNAPDLESNAAQGKKAARPVLRPKQNAGSEKNAPDLESNVAEGKKAARPLFMAKENAGSEKNAAAESNATQGKKAARPLSPLLPVELTRDRPKLFAVEQNAGPEKNAAPESNTAPGENAAMISDDSAENSDDGLLTALQNLRRQNYVISILQRNAAMISDDSAENSDDGPFTVIQNLRRQKYAISQRNAAMISDDSAENSDDGLFAVKQNAGPEKNAAPESNAAPGKNAAMLPLLQEPTRDPYKDGWSLARNSRGVTGSIPSNYVEKKDLSTSHETNGSSKETKTKKQIKQEWERKLDEEEERREEEAWKGLKLQAELCRRRDQLFDYKFGDKIGLDNFSGLNIDDVIQLRIGVFGPSGSGKSWFINTCERAIRETEKGTATEGNTGKEETVMLEDYLPEMFFHLTDTRGFFDYHSTELVAFENILNGKLQPSDIIYLQQSNPNRQKFHQSPTFGQRMHGVIFVLYANDPRLKDGAMKDHLEPFRGVLRKNGIVPVTVVSLMDRLHSIEDYRENLLNASEATGSSLSHTFWMPTYPTRNTPCNLAIVRSSFDILDIVLASAENMVKFWKLKEVSLEVFLRLLQKKYQLLTSSIDEVLSQLAEEDITSVCLLELGWEEIKHFFSPHVRGIIEQELKILSEEMEDIPPHILARGPSALKAYKKAIAEGKTFVRRVPIMLIGQDRSGKTSLKRSLRGQIFDEDENSTVGVTVDPSYFKVSHDVWKVGEKDEGVNSGTTFSYEYQAARLTVENLNEEQEFMFPQNLEEDMLIKETLPIKKLSGFKESRAPSIPSSQRVPVKTERAEERIPDTHSVSSGSVLTPEISHDLSLDPADVPMKNWESSDLSQVKITGEKRGGDSIKDMPADVASIIEMLLQSEDITKCEEDVFSVLWDFGGQTVYHATHPLFLTSNAIFLLVSDLSRNPFEKVKSPKQGMFTELEDSHSLKTNMDYLDFWMSSVASLAIQDEGNPVVTQSDVLPEKLPPVFLVCTHADMPHDRRGPKVQAGMVFGHLQNKPYNVHLYDDVFVVDNTKSGHESECPEVVRLRKEVLAVAKKLPQAKQAVPIRWLKFEKAIQTTKEEGRKWIPLQSAKDIASDVCDIVDDDEFSALLNFLHDQRILIHFDDTPNLNKMVVLDVQWLIDVLKEVITVRPYDGKEKKFKDLWKKLEKEGVLEEDLLEHVWGSSYDDGETRESLVAIMEKFSLLCPLPSSDGSCSRTYLVPSMLMSHPPEDVLELVASAEAPPLFLRFESGQVPSGLFCRLVLQLFQWCKQEYASPEYPQLYLNFARFYNSEEGNCSVILLCRMSSIEVVVHRGSSSNWETHRSKSKTTSPLHNNDDTFACAVLRQLELMLESMRIEFWWLQNMKYAVQFLCPVCCPGGAVSYCRTHLSKGCKQDECLHFWSKSELCRNMKNICCTRSATAKSNSISLKYFEAWFRSKRNQQPTCSEDDDGSLASSDATQLCLTRERVGEDITPQMKEVLQLEGTCFGTPISDSKREQALATSNKTTEVFLPENVQQSLLIPSRDAKEVVFQLKENLQLDQDFLERPDLETTKLIRSLAQKAKEFKRLDVFKLLKEIAPAGTTGPLLPENLPVQNIPFAKARELTINLSGGDEWMGVVEGLGLTPQEIRFLDKRTLNPMAAALSFIVKRRHLSVDELYELLIEQGFPKMADLL